MSRDHARIKTSIWQDGDFRGLPPPAQHLYFTIVSQKALSYCGVLDYLPRRLAVLSEGQTEAKINAAAKLLERERFVMIDRATSELLARSYVRHDGVLDRVNMGKAVASAVASVVSLPLRDAVLAELARLHDETPGLAGWIGFKTASPEAYAMVCGMPSGVR